MNQCAPEGIVRVQNNSNAITQESSKTSRTYPPFCIQPMTFSPRVETFGELDVIDYLVCKQPGEMYWLSINGHLTGLKGPCSKLF